jgi:hypothetical protein
MPASLYKNGSLLTLNPIESSSMFLFVVIMCAACEYLFSQAEAIDSKFFHSLLDSISEEFLVIGVMSLALTLFGTFVEFTGTWNTMVEWSQVCLLFMMIFFVLVIISLAASTFRSNKAWQKVEELRSHLQIVDLAGNELYFRQATMDFETSCEVFGFKRGAIPFSRYLLKIEKANLSLLADMSWRTWVALSIVLVANVLRTRVISGVENPHPGFVNPVQPGSFIAVIGFGTFGLFIFSHRVMAKRLTQYLERRMVAEASLQPAAVPWGERRAATVADLDDPRSFLLWRSLDNTVAIFQCVILFFVWYLAVFVLNILHLVVNAKSSAISAGLFVAAMVPIVAFLAIFPSTLTMMAMLSSLGTATDVERLKDILSTLEDLRATEDPQKMESFSPIAVNQREPEAAAPGRAAADADAPPPPRWAPPKPIQL